MTVEPKPAASLLVLRHDTREVLMGLRGAGHKFMPNRLVFPGGRVDPEDHHIAPATPLSPETNRRLARAAPGTLAQAIAIAAARELEEETGLTLGTPPALDGLTYLCRAITPESQPIRFDARFLVIDAQKVTGTLAGSGELENLAWYTLDAALALDLAFATRSVLLKLIAWLENPTLGEKVPTMRSREWSEE